MNLSEYPQRFSKKVIVDLNSGCWNFNKHKTGRYGMYFNGVKVVGAHRYSWCLANSKTEIPDNLNVLHKCDNTKCVNPAHLFLGTQLDNVHDMMAKGRTGDTGQPPGEAHALAKLVEADILAIRTRAMSGETSDAIAGDYCVGIAQIHRIITGKRWGHIPYGIQQSKPASDRVKPEDFYEIRRRRQSGEKLQDIADAFGVSIATVSRIANGKVKEPHCQEAK